MTKETIISFIRQEDKQRHAMLMCIWAMMLPVLCAVFGVVWGCIISVVAAAIGMVVNEIYDAKKDHPTGFSNPDIIAGSIGYGLGLPFGIAYVIAIF